MNLEKQSQIKTLIARGKEKGYLTYAEVTDHLPEIVDSEQLDDVISMINSMGIVVHDEAPDEESILLPEPAAATVEEDEDEIEEAAAQLAALDDQFGRTTDPVRMYMREMGSVELLDREGEIRIAKRIEEGLNEAFYAMAMYPETTAILLEAYDAVKAGKRRLADVVVGFFDPNAAPPAEGELPPDLKDEEPEEKDEKEGNGDGDEEETVDTGPDPVEAAKNFTDLQKLFDKAWEALEKLGSQDKKTQKKREALAEHLMTFRLSPKIVDEVQRNLRAKAEQVRTAERTIMRICVMECGMPRKEFLEKFPGHSADKNFVSRITRGDKKYARAIAKRGDEIKALQDRLRALEIENRDDISGLQPAQEPGRSAKPDLDLVRRIADELEPLGAVLHLERHAHEPLDDMLAGDREPQQRRDRQRENLEAEVAERVVRHQRSYAGRPARLRPRRSISKACSRARSPSAVTFRSMCPSTAMEISPRSSDTTMATASVSSVRPIAARWRVPRSRSSFGFTVSGRKHAAAATRPSWMIAAPSWSGDPVWKIVTSRS